VWQGRTGNRPPYADCSKTRFKRVCKSHIERALNEETVFGQGAIQPTMNAL
jgi:hypothetical protein